jgi:hypothetical protein
VWSAFGLAVFLLAASASGVERKHLLFVAFAPAVALNLFFGQNGCLTAALLIGGLINLDRRPILAGVLFGILTVKPQLGTLLPVMLVLTGRWRVIAAAVVTTAGMVAVTSWLYGVDIWWEYLDKAAPVQRYGLEKNGGLTLLQMPSAFMAGRLIGLPIRIDWAIQMVISVLALAAVVWTFWRPRDQILSTALLLTAIFLFSPYALNYDFVVLAWVAALVRQRPDNNRFDHALILALWTLPVTMMIVGLAKIPLGFLVLAGFGARILQRLAQSEASGAPACTAGGVIPIRST